MSDKEKRMAAMKKRLKKSTPKISGRANLENMNQIKNFMFGNKKSMGIDDDVKGIATQKAKKKIADSKNKKKTAIKIQGYLRVLSVVKLKLHQR